jgi:hypothetical protein
MAAEGYILQKFRLLGAVFEKSEPVKVRYRILQNPEEKLFHTDGITARESFIALQRNNGWLYYGETYINFSVFACYDDQITEPNRDIRAWIKRWRNSSIWVSVIFALFAGGTFLWLALKDILTVLFFIENETWKYLFLILAYPAYSWVESSIQFHAMKKYLSNDVYVKPDWSKNICRSRVANCLEFMLLILVLVGILAVGNTSSPRPVLTEDNTYTVPFPLVEEFVGEDTVEQYNYNTYVYTGEDLLAPITLQVRQMGQVHENVDYSTIIKIKYYKTHTSWLATQIAKDYYKIDRYSYIRGGFLPSFIDIYELPDLGVDYAAAYHMRTPIIVLADGKEVIHIECHQLHAMDDITLTELAQVYAEYLLTE